MAHAVFISHSSKDKPIADAICAGLEFRSIRCWIAPRDIAPGQNYAGQLLKAIESCKVFVILLSENSSLSSHVIKEVEIAMQSGATILPFRIQDITPSDDLKYYLSNVHWLDALTPPLEKHIKLLAEYINRIINAPVAYLKTSTPDEPADQQKEAASKPEVEKKTLIKTSTRKIWGWIGGVGIVLIGLFSWSLSQGFFSPTQAETSTLSATNTLLLEKNNTPVPPTLQSSPTITATATPEVFTANLVKNGVCRSQPDNIHSCYANLEAGITLVMRGKSSAGDWINIAYDTMPQGECWLYIADEKLDVQIEDLPLPVFTPRPVKAVLKGCEIYAQNRDGSTYQGGCTKSTDADAVIRDAESQCATLTASGGYCDGYRIMTWGLCEY